jgi:hypothetical protein
LVLTGSYPDDPSVDDCQAASERSDVLAVVSVALAVAPAAAGRAVAALAAAVVAVAVLVVAAADAPAARCGTYWLRFGRLADVVPQEEPVAPTGAAVWERPDEPKAAVPGIVPVHSGAEHFVVPAAAIPDDWLAAPADFGPADERDYLGEERSPARLPGRVDWDAPVRSDVQVHFRARYWRVLLADSLRRGASVLPER